MEHPILTTFAGLVGIILLVSSNIIATFASKRYWWLSFVCAFLAGFLPGVCAYNLWTGILFGLFIAIFVVPSSILAGYFRRKALARLKNMDK